MNLQSKHEFGDGKKLFEEEKKVWENLVDQENSSPVIKTIHLLNPFAPAFYLSFPFLPVEHSSSSSREE